MSGHDATKAMSTPKSDSKLAASVPKDRACPYCGVQFTSSSLGRHLDLYIRGKNPKAPDGIHNVEEIRENRGQITRRHIKTGVKRDRAGNKIERNKRPTVETGGLDGSHDADAQDGESDEDSEAESDDPAQQDHQESTPTNKSSRQFTDPHWTATGVINDLPTSNTSSGVVQGAIRPVIREFQNRGSVDATNGNLHLRPIATSVEEQNEERVRGRAAELALRELTESIKSAGLRVYMPRAFDFDFTALSFPGLCLKLLPPPSNLATSYTTASRDTWTTNPPGQKQLSALLTKFNSRLSEWEKELKSVRIRNSLTGVKMGSEEDATELDKTRVSLESRECGEHIDRVWHTWNSLSETEKQRQWNNEGFLAFTSESKELRDTRAELERTKNELANANQHIQRLTTWKMPREWLLWAPEQIPMEKKAATMVAEDYAKLLDADALIGKWRPRVVQAEQTLNRPAHHLSTRRGSIDESSRATPASREPQLPPPAPLAELRRHENIYDSANWSKEPQLEVGKGKITPTLLPRPQQEYQSNLSRDRSNISDARNEPMPRHYNGIYEWPQPPSLRSPDLFTQTQPPNILPSLSSLPTTPYGPATSALRNGAKPETNKILPFKHTV